MARQQHHRFVQGPRRAADRSAHRSPSWSTPLRIHRRVRRSSAFYLAAISRPPKRSEERNATRYTLQTQNLNPKDTHELQSRALQVGPTPMTTSEMMTASSAGASPMLMGRSAKQRHSSVIAGS